MRDEKLWVLISLKLSGEASFDELAELDNYLEAHPKKSLEAEILTKIWEEKYELSDDSKEQAFNRHLRRLKAHFSKEEAEENPNADLSQTPSTKKNRRYWLWIATGVAASAIPVVLFFQYRNLKPKSNNQIAANTITTNPGSKSKIQLPDGTQVWLNADSRLIYDESFQGPTREVHLVGEAYFDVTRDKEHPFIIHTAAIDVKVLGTAFNVRSYTNEKQTEATLIRGSLEITPRNNPDRKIILKPNEKLVVANNQQLITRTKTQVSPLHEDATMMVLSRVHIQKEDSIANEILWTKNKLSFDNENLENVALKIERWYDVKVTITDEKLKHTAYTAVFENESLQTVMEALQWTGHFRYTINKKEVIIKP